MSRVLTLVLLMFVAGPVAAAAASQTPQPPAHEGFVPVDELPGQEQLPAAPLVATAYGVAWAAIFIYAWFLWRRLARVERELNDLSRRLETGARK